MLLAHFKSNALFCTENDALQIQLFYEDFETANPVGSKKGLHKLGAIYFTLRNFPPFLTPHWITFIYVPSFMHRILDSMV